MTPELRQQITEKLRGYLNREPSESEIMNGQTDAHIQQWITQDTLKAHKDAFDIINKKIK